MTGQTASQNRAEAFSAITTIGVRTMTMPVKTRQRIERLIAEALIDDALKAGYEVTINNGGDGNEIPFTIDKAKILDAMFAADEDFVIVRPHDTTQWGKRKEGWVRFIYGNSGYDVISDYTTNLEHIMAGANAESEKWG